MRYSELSLSALSAAWEAGAPAIVPWGALEWHGAHLPLGLDGLVVEAFCDRLAERTQGVLLPAIWLPITTLPHPASLQVRTEAFRMIVDDTIAGLVASGARTILLVSGHYAQGHLIELFEAAMRGMDDHEGVRILAGTPLQPLESPSLLDHAGRYETSQLLALRPDLVWTSELPRQIVPRSDAVLGEDPRLGTAEEGTLLFERGLDAWSAWWRDATPAALEETYKRRFDELQPYVDAYYEGSWEEAIQKWWAEMDQR